jgi:hypothetical protein
MPPERPLAFGRAAHEYDTSPAIDDHTGCRKTDSGGSASDNDSPATKSFKIVCNLLWHFLHLASIDWRRPLWSDRDTTFTISATDLRS